VDWREIDMVEIVCLVETEDYWNINSLVEKNIPIKHYGYRFQVLGGAEGEGSKEVEIVVFELLNASVSVGLYLPERFAETTQFKLGFTSQTDPTSKVSVECSLSPEVKKVSYEGSERERLEYIGFTLERFYADKGATFYLYDLKGVDGGGG